MVIPKGDYVSMRCVFISLLPECDFEENHLCGFVNRWNPNVNWFVGGGTTRNSHSILPQDHTFRNEMGKLWKNGSYFCHLFLPSCIGLTVALSTEKGGERRMSERPGGLVEL